MQQWKPGRRGDESESHYAHGYRHTGIQQHHHRAIAFRDHFGLWIKWHANRLGGSIQRKLHVIRHYAQLRLGDHYDSGRIARHWL